MAIATIGGANAVSPAGASSIIVQGYSSTGTYTYTPSTPLPATLVFTLWGQQV